MRDIFPAKKDYPGRQFHGYFLLIRAGVIFKIGKIAVLPLFSLFMKHESE
jgi:hypothetical protein